MLSIDPFTYCNIPDCHSNRLVFYGWLQNFSCHISISAGIFLTATVLSIVIAMTIRIENGQMSAPESGGFAKNRMIFAAYTLFLFPGANALLAHNAI